MVAATGSLCLSLSPSPTLSLSLSLTIALAHADTRGARCCSLTFWVPFETGQRWLCWAAKADRRADRRASSPKWLRQTGAPTDGRSRAVGLLRKSELNRERVRVRVRVRVRERHWLQCRPPAGQVHKHTHTHTQCCARTQLVRARSKRAARQASQSRAFFWARIPGPTCNTRGTPAHCCVAMLVHRATRGIVLVSARLWECIMTTKNTLLLLAPPPHHPHHHHHHHRPSPLLWFFFYYFVAVFIIIIILLLR